MRLYEPCLDHLHSLLLALVVRLRQWPMAEPSRHVEEGTLPPSPFCSPFRPRHHTTSVEGLPELKQIPIFAGGSRQFPSQQHAAVPVKSGIGLIDADLGAPLHQSRRQLSPRAPWLTARGSLTLSLAPGACRRGDSGLALGRRGRSGVTGAGGARREAS